VQKLNEGESLKGISGRIKVAEPPKTRKMISLEPSINLSDFNGQHMKTPGADLKETNLKFRRIRG